MVGSESFTTSTSGTLEITVDWAFPTSLMGVYLVKGECTLDQFNLRACDFLVRSEPSLVKPRKLTAGGLAAGTYNLLVANFSEDDEYASVEVVLATGSCTSSGSFSASNAKGQAKVNGSKTGFLHR